MENDYGYKPDNIEVRNKALVRIIMLILLMLFGAIIANISLMFFSLEDNDVEMIYASKYPLKIFIEKPKLTDKVDVYEVLENNNSPEIEKIIPVKPKEPKVVDLKLAEEMQRRVLDVKKIKEAENITEGVISNSGFRAQIAAMSKKEKAKKYWQNITKKYPKIFKNLQYFIQRIDLPNRDSLFRLQITGFKNEFEVEDFCLKFIYETKQSHANCIIITP